MREGKNFWKKFFPSRVFFPTHSSSIASIDLPIEAMWAWKFDTKIEKMPALVAGWILNPAASNHNPTSKERLWGKSQKPIGIGGVSPLLLYNIIITKYLQIDFGEKGNFSFVQQGRYKKITNRKCCNFFNKRLLWILAWDGYFETIFLPSRRGHKM